MFKTKCRDRNPGVNIVTLESLLKIAVDKRASDLHITFDAPPVLRVFGDLMFTDFPPVTNEILQGISNEVLSEEQKVLLEMKGQVDLSVSFPQLGRFRINIFKQRNTVGIAIRLIPNNIPSFDGLGIPPVVKELSRKRNGFILVTGPTGSGKSTTLASIINLINSESKRHIITLEDPIEFLHTHKKCLVNQREMGTDFNDFSLALRSSLRQDPDVILLGEMRDLETISAAITAAETGHLVLSTLHTNDASSTIDRIMGVFPPHEQQQIRIQLANTLLGVISQRLLPSISPRGLFPATEVMICTSAIKNLIREGKTHQIYSMIQTGSKHGMQTMENSIAELVRKGILKEPEESPGTIN